MRWSIVLVLVLEVCVLSAHTAVYKTQDATLNRIARSPYYGASYHHDDFELPSPPTHGPPPPPVVYHTQNWSGVAKGPGGAAQGVFSGAAASAQSAVPALSEAFSIAASGTGPVSIEEGGQVKENLGKSGFGSHTNYDSSGSHHSFGSFGNKYGGASNGFGSSGEGQYKIKSSGSDRGGGVAGSGSEENQSGRFNTGVAEFDSKLDGSESTGNEQSSGHLKSVESDRESGQRSINSGFGGKSFGGESAGYGSHSRQYGSSRGFSDTRNRGDIDSGSLTDGNSDGSESADFDSQSRQHNLKTSNNGLEGFNGQSDQFNAGSGLSDKTVSGPTASINQFGQYDSQSSRSGYQRGGPNRRFDSHGGGYGVRQEFQNHGGYGGGYDGDIHRNAKSHHDFHNFEQKGKQFGYQGNGGQGLGDNRQIGSAESSGSQSSSFGTNRGNYGSGSVGSEAGYSGNLGQVEQSGKLDAGFTSSHGGSRDFSGGQQVKQLGNLDASFSANQAGSQKLSGGQSQSSSATDYDSENSASFKGSSKGALVVTDANGGISPTNEAGGSPSADAGASGHEDNIQATLGSALNLAAQGLQTAQRAPCSTCDKGSYALSNAKSHSGSAIALSIGG